MDMLTLVTSAVPDRSLGFTLTVVIAGIGIVLFTLLLLILVFYAFGAIVSKSQNAAKKKAEKKNQPPQLTAQPVAQAQAPVAPAPAPVVEQGISGEVVAAISAAVYSMDGGTTVIKSITRKNPISARNPWAQSAVIDNTRPF
ncbi:MAG: OadG family transporter subunit [Eubacterium sp.]